MSKNMNHSSYSRNRTDSRIGAGVRVDGQIGFTGVLRVQGNVVGDVSCATDPQGTIVVERSASVTGVISAPQVLIQGRVLGTMASSQLIEVQAGACCIGGAIYREIRVNAGGIIDGLMTPTTLPDHETGGEEGVAKSASSSTNSGNGHKVAWAAALLIATTGAAWVILSPASPPSPVAVVAVDTVSAKTDPVLAQSFAVRATSVVAETVVPPPETKAPLQTMVVSNPDVRLTQGENKVLTVQGMNASKSSGILFMVTREPTVLYKKKRDDASQGTRMDIAQGRNISIPITKNEQIRIAKGRDLEIFYQGRKVAQSTIDGGVWMSFVPLLPGDVISPQ